MKDFIMLRKYFCFITFAVILTLHIFCETIAIACFQNEDADEHCKTVTAVFEDSLLDCFFENGFIVTSIPVASVKSQNEILLEEITKFFEEPTEYILICYLQYGQDLIFNNKLGKKIPDWESLYASFVHFSTGEKIYSKTFYMNAIKETELEKKSGAVSMQIAKAVIKTINKREK